jgi:hypothetical protein
MILAHLGIDTHGLFSLLVVVALIVFIARRL